MSKLFRKLTVVFVLISLVFSQTGLVYLGSFLSPKEAQAGIIPEPQGTVTLKKGWNLISPSDETMSSEYLSGCEVASGPWYWDSEAYKYRSTEELRPMNAYWVRVDEDCTLEVGSEGEGDRTKKSTTLKPGWNLISSTSNYNWDQLKGSCNLSINWLFEAQGSDYSMLPPAANLEAFRGYWVKVESSCSISEPVTTFSVEDLYSIDDSFYCYLSQGSPADSCDLARVIEKNGTEYCRYYNDMTCDKTSGGRYEWSCGTPSETARPGSNYECTEIGWKEIPDSQDDQSALKLDLCNITGSLLSNLLGKFAENFTGEVLVGLFGEDVAKKVQGVVDFYFWLEARGIDPIELAQNPDPDFFAEHLNDFIDLGVGALKDLAANVVKDFIVEFALELKMNPGVAQELGNFAAYLVQNGEQLASLSSAEKIADFLLDFAKESASPLLEKLVKAEKIINLIKVGLNIESIASASEIRQAINSLSSSLIDNLQDEFELTDQELNDIVGFVKYLVDSRDLSLKEILQQTKADLEAYWNSYASSRGITLQRGFEIIKDLTYDIAASAINELLDIVEIDVEVDEEMVQMAIDNRLIEKAVQFIKYLLFDKSYDFSEISVEIEGDGFSARLSESGIDVDIDSQVLLRNAVNYLVDIALDVAEENFGLTPQMIKYGIDFINYTINAEGKNIESFLEYNISSFIGSVESYVASRGKAILVQIVVDVVKPYIEESLGIDPELLAEVARFAKFLTETKNISLEEVASFALDRVEDLLIEFAAKGAERLTGIRYDVLHRLFKIIINQDLIQDIVHLDLKSIVQKLLIRVEINGNFACPVDLVSLACTLVNGENWEDCSTGQLPAQNASPPNHTVKIYDPNNIHAASIGICSVPNIYISVLGEPIIKGIDIKVGPIAYRGTKLRIDMPTTNRITWGDGSDRQSLYKARFNDGLYHQYPSSGDYNAQAKCRFILNIDIFGFHWPTVSQTTNKTISAP